MMLTFLKGRAADVIWLQAQLQMLDYIGKVLEAAEVNKIPMEVVRTKILWDIHRSVREVLLNILTRSCAYYLPSIEQLMTETLIELEKKQTEKEAK